MRSRPIAVAVATLAVMAATAAAQQAPNSNAVIAGAVTDSATGAPVAGASVTFQRSGRSVFTDERGGFRIKLPQGPDTLAVEQLGYHTAHLAIVVDSGMAPPSVRLAPNPVLLKGIAVINRRLASNPLAIAMAVRTFDEKDLARSNGWSVRQFLDSRGAFTPVPCPMGAWSSACIWSRGQVIEPRVWLDDFRLFGGLEELTTVSSQDIYRVDVYQRGLYIHVVSKWWMERALRHDYPVFFPFY